MPAFHEFLVLLTTESAEKLFTLFTIEVEIGVGVDGTLFWEVVDFFIPFTTFFRGVVLLDAL